MLVNICRKKCQHGYLMLGTHVTHQTGLPCSFSHWYQYWYDHISLHWYHYWYDHFGWTLQSTNLKFKSKGPLGWSRQIIVTETVPEELCKGTSEKLLSRMQPLIPPFQDHSQTLSGPFPDPSWTLHGLFTDPKILILTYKKTFELHSLLFFVSQRNLRNFENIFLKLPTKHTSDQSKVLFIK